MVTQQQLTDAYSSLSGRLMDQAGLFAINTFRSLGSWRDADAVAYERLMRNTLMGLKRQATNLTTGYYRQIAESQGQPFESPSVTLGALTTQALRNGVDAETVYRRPFVELWTALDKGKTMTEAIEAGAFRARTLATTELQLARRNVGLEIRGRNNRIVGYIRTLTGRENCALCYVASTQRYNRGDLLPIHPGCDCGELPLYGNSDPGQVINEELLEATHQAVEERFGLSDRGARAIDYRDIQIRDHGEMGPMLTVRGQHFTGPDDL
jgi:hypothetical protein